MAVVAGSGMVIYIHQKYVILMEIVDFLMTD
jgi:hypothetical protein